MKNVFNWKKTLAALCVLALLVSVLPASVLADEMVEIPESDYIYVNEDSKIVTAQEEMSLLRLTVETAGKFHVLASGVDIKLVLFDETAGTVRDVYSSENGLMDVPFYAAPGMYLLGIIGSGEVAIRVADEAETEKIYSSEVVAEEPAKEEVTEESAEEATEETPAEQPAAEPVVEEPAFDPSVPISYKGVIGETVSVLAILQDAGAPVEAVTYVSGNVDGILVSSADSVNLGNWLLTPCGYFDSVTLIVKTIEDVDYTLVVSCPAPVEEVEPAEAPAEEVAEEVTEEPAEVTEDTPAEETAEEVTEEAPAVDAAEEVIEEAPAEETAEEVIEEAPAEEAPAEETVEAPVEEAEEEEKGFLAGFVDWFTGNSSKKTTEEEAEPAEDDEEANEPVDETTADESADEASDEAEDIKEVEETEEPAEEPDEEPAEETEEETEEEISEEPEGEPEAELPEEEVSSDSAAAELTPEESLTPESQIYFQVASNEQITLLPILTEAGVPVNTITSVTGEVDGKVILADQGNGDWVITPYAYFDSLELTVTATDYLAEDSAEAEAVYTVILTNPDPDAAPAQEAEPAEEVEEEAAEEVTEATEEEKETEESSDEALLTTNYSLPIDSVTIDVERQEDNAVRLFAEDIGEEEAEAYAYQWQYSLDGEEWFDVEGATEKDYNFQLDETNGSYYWRLVVSYI